MEALREEIATLSALRDAQAALLAWNREGTKTGVAGAGTPRRALQGPGARRLVSAAAGDLRRPIDGGRP